MFRVDAEKFTGAAGPLNGTKLFLQPPKFSPASSPEDTSKKKKKSHPTKNAKTLKTDAQRPKSLRSGERAAPVRNRDGRGEPIQRRVSAGSGIKTRPAPVLLQGAYINETVALRTASAGRTGEHEAGGLKKSKLSQTRLGSGRRCALSSSRAPSKSDYFYKVGLSSSVSPPSPPASHDKQVNSHTRARATMHLLFSRLAVGGDHGSFTFGVHAGFCFKTFAPLNTCQRKQPGKRSISIATPLVFFPPPFSSSSFSPLLLLPSLSLLYLPLFLSLSLFLHLQHWPQIRHSFYWGDLKPSAVGFFFFPSLPSSAAVPQTSSSSLRCARGGGSLKGNAHFLFTDLRNMRREGGRGGGTGSVHYDVFQLLLGHRNDALLRHG